MDLAGNAVLGGALRTAIAPAQIPNPDLEMGKDRTV
jgi:hypothetical protein